VIRALATFGLAAVLSGCNQNQATPTGMPGMSGMPGMTGLPGVGAVPGMPATVAMPATAAGAVVEPTSADLPMPEDFEEEAVTKVQEANFRSELDRIDHEVGTTH
jgi:hypothetical protein